MQSISKKLFHMVLAMTLMLSFVGTRTVLAAEEEQVEITILETSDLHGMLYNYDYAADAETKMGLVKAATVIKEERKKDPELLLVDCGDTLQGNLVSNFRHEEINPVIQAMNALKYNTWTIGNHDFDYEFNTLLNAINTSQAKVLGGNIYKADGTRFVEPYSIFEVKGVKVAIFGLVTPYVTRWVSDPAKYNTMTFADPMTETDKILKELEEKADVIIGVVHIGEEGDSAKDGMNAIAQKYADKIDALMIGHSHANIVKSLVNGSFVNENTDDSTLVMVEPGVNGANVGKCTITLEKQDGVWKVIKRSAELISTADKEADKELMELLKPVHNTSLLEADKVIGTIGADFYDEVYLLPGIPNGLLEDHALADLINLVQQKESGADVSMAALSSPDSNLTAGEFKFKDGVKVYKFDNTLYAAKVTGKQLKMIMEKQAGALYNMYREGDVTISFDPSFRLYKYDMFAGVNYEINISKPVGERIQNVTYNGVPLKDSTILVLALNDYRFSSLVADGLIDGDAVVYNSKNDAEFPAVRDMIAEYIKEQGTVYPECDQNWKITGADLEDPQKELIYEMIRSGELSVPASEDGRDQNIASLNANDLRASGRIPDIEEETPVVPENPEESEKPIQPEDAGESEKPVPPSEQDKEAVVKRQEYKIKSGDTIFKIAMNHGVSVQDILAINEISDKNKIFEGKTIYLPVVNNNAEDGVYVIITGDCLSKIAKRFHCSVEELASLNDIKDVDKIYSGQKLNLPKAS